MRTTMIIPKGATADASMVMPHSDNDEPADQPDNDEPADQRLIRMPAADPPAASRRPVLAESYRTAQ